MYACCWRPIRSFTYVFHPSLPTPFLSYLLVGLLVLGQVRVAQVAEDGRLVVFFWEETENESGHLIDCHRRLHAYTQLHASLSTQPPTHTRKQTLRTHRAGDAELVEAQRRHRGGGRREGRAVVGVGGVLGGVRQCNKCGGGMGPCVCARRAVRPPAPCVPQGIDCPNRTACGCGRWARGRLHVGPVPCPSAAANQPYGASPVEGTANDPFVHIHPSWTDLPGVRRGGREGRAARATGQRGEQHGCACGGRLTCGPCAA